jgi:hypothetical protein
LGAELAVCLTAATIFCVCRYLLRRLRQAGINPWASAIGLTIAYYAFRYGWGALVVFYWEFMPWEAVPALRSRFYYQGARLEVENVCELILLGGFGLLIGALLRTESIERLLPDIRWSVDNRRFQRNVILFSPVALILFLLVAPRMPQAARLAVELVGRTTYLLIVLIAYWLFTARSSAERAKWQFLLILTGGFSLCLGLMSGLLGEILAPAAFTVFGYMLARAAVPWKWIAIVVPIAFLVLLPFLTLYKETAFQHIDASIMTRISYAKEKLAITDYRRGVELGLDRFVARMAESSYPPIFARYYPDVYPYANGRSLWIEAATLVPRFFWPTKPSMSEELDRYSVSVGLIREVGAGTSMVFDAVSEYYVNFGPPGVFFLSLLHGIYLTVVGSWFNSNLKQPLSGSLNAATFFTNPEFFGVGQAFTLQIKLIPVWIVVLYVLSKRIDKQLDWSMYSLRKVDHYASAQYLRSDIQSRLSHRGSARYNT